EMSFSLREKQEPNGEKKVILVDAILAETRGGGSSTADTNVSLTSIPKGAHSAMSHLVELDGPLELAPGKFVPVWAYVIDKKDGSRPPAEAAKASRWAILIKLKWEHPPKDE
ncbi:MAG TPA: hypothetical protein VLM40_11975, partial [Gemmata sp.]|nr:hypothetical protein [Gemmata sp.]